MENKSVLLVVLIAALLVTVGLQTVQLAAMSSASVSFPAASSGSSAPASSSGATTPANLANLPSMVGGC